MMKNVYPFYFQYEVQPAPENAEFGSLAGAIATVIVFAETAELARARAGRRIGRDDYRIIEVKRSMLVRSHQVEHMDGVLKSVYELAGREGVGVVYDVWKKRDSVAGDGDNIST